MVLSIRTYWASSGQHSSTLFCYKTPLEAGTLMGMVFYRNDENNPLTLGLLCCSTSHLHVPVPSFLFRDIWPLISLREKEESVSVTNSINHFPLSSFHVSVQGTAAVL